MPARADALDASSTVSDHRLRLSSATSPPPPPPLPRRRLRADLSRVLRAHLAPAHDEPRREHVRRVGHRQLSPATRRRRTSRTTSAGCTTPACRSATRTIPPTKRRARSSPRSSSPTSIAAWSASARFSTRSRIPIITLQGYEADDVIGTLAGRASSRRLNVVVVSGDKDFQQLVRPGVWLLNPGRGGPASVEEHWVSVENGSERLGVPPALVTDYLALVGDCRTTCRA